MSVCVRRGRKWLGLLAVAVVGLFSVGGTAVAATPYAVTNLNNSGAGSLRQAITDANTNPGADTIKFAVSGTITLVSTLPAISDDLTVVNDYGILEGTRQGLTINGNGLVSVMRINAGVKVNLASLTIANGSGTSGGGIDNAGALSVTESTFSDNTATGNGGAINNTGALTLSNCTFSGNSAPNGVGGAINDAGSLLMFNCTIAGNSASAGSGLYLSSTLTELAQGFNNIIVNNNSDDIACFGPVLFPLTNSLFGPSNGCVVASPTNAFSDEPGLVGPLADNGGPTKTFAITTGSQAYNLGASQKLIFNGVGNVSVHAPGIDQRGVGFARPCLGGYDAGAFEVPESPDLGSPVAAPTQSPDANGAGWNNSDVTVRWNWSDCGDGINYASTTTSSTSSGEGSSLTLTATANDNAGHSTTASYTLKIDKTAPVLTVPANVTVVASSQAGATVSYAAASATDGGSGVASVGCSPPSGTLFPIGTTTVSCTATDVAGNGASGSFTVQVKASAAMQLSDLLTQVTGVGPGASLANKVTQIQAYVSANNKASACSLLNAFISEVAAQTGKKLTTAQAASFTTQANNIKATLGC